MRFLLSSTRSEIQLTVYFLLFSQQRRRKEKKILPTTAKHHPPWLQLVLLRAPCGSTADDTAATACVSCPTWATPTAAMRTNLIGSWSPFSTSWLAKTAATHVISLGIKGSPVALNARHTISSNTPIDTVLRRLKPVAMFNASYRQFRNPFSIYKRKISPDNSL